MSRSETELSETGSSEGRPSGFLKNLNPKSGFFLISLVLLFAVSFAVPLFFAAQFGGIFYSPEQEEEHSSKNYFFHNPVKIPGPNSYIEVKHSDGLNPVEGEDYLMVFWVRFKKLPASGEKISILSKFDQELRSRRGFAFALGREPDALKPEVYWRDDQNGTWFKFAEAHIIPDTWTMFVISFRSSKFLGLHYANVVENLEPEIKLLGGYDFETPVYPKSRSDLMIGAFNSGKFKGQIGAAGIISRKNLTEDLHSILEDLLHSPLKPPGVIRKDELKLWITDGAADRSGYSNQVTLVKPRRK